MKNYCGDSGGKTVDAFGSKRNELNFSHYFMCPQAWNAMKVKKNAFHNNEMKIFA